MQQFRPIKTRWLKGGMSDEAYDSLIDQAEKSSAQESCAAEDVAEVLVWFRKVHP